MSWADLMQEVYNLQSGLPDQKFISAVTFAKAYFSFYTTRPLVSQIKSRGAGCHAYV
jgi:hypothetical protein